MINKEVNIIGASAFGILLALALRKKYEKKFLKINIFERSDTILSSWESILLDSKKLNRGFFGIEIPRAEEFKILLGEDFISSNFISIPNYKLLLIDSFLVPYQYSLEQMCSKYREEIKLIINKKFNLTDALQNKEFRNFKFLDLIKFCSIRYSDDFYESCHLFYPWFFPIDTFRNFKNISAQNSADFYSEYLIPKNGVFSDIRNNLEILLSKRNINLIKNHNINFSKLTNSKDSSEKHIWASSTIPLLNMYAPNVINKLKRNKRYLGLYLFKIHSNKLQIWRRKFDKPPSEIISLNKKFPTVSRISFPDYLKKEHYSYLLLEINSKSNNYFSDKEISLIEEWLSDIFESEISFCSSKFISHSFNPPMHSYEVVEDYFDKFKDTLPVSVPFRYWWPINTTHAVKAAYDYAE